MTALALLRTAHRPPTNFAEILCGSFALIFISWFAVWSRPNTENVGGGFGCDVTE